jgi:hypothetical protein
MIKKVLILDNNNSVQNAYCNIKNMVILCLTMYCIYPESYSTLARFI